MVEHAVEDASYVALLCEPQLRVHTGALHDALGVLMSLVSRFEDPAGATATRLGGGRGVLSDSCRGQRRRPRMATSIPPL
jgi:hypothetical protein